MMNLNPNNKRKQSHENNNTTDVIIAKLDNIQQNMFALTANMNKINNRDKLIMDLLHTFNDNLIDYIGNSKVKNTKQEIIIYQKERFIQFFEKENFKEYFERNILTAYHMKKYT